MELDEICFEGIDTLGDLSNLELFMTAEGLEDPVPLWIYLSEGVLHTTVPLHPVTPGAGGTIELQLVDGDERSPRMTVELSGIPASPGAWQRTIDLMKDVLGARAAEHGTTLDVVAATSFEEVSPELLPVKLILTYIDDGTDDDLESLLTSSAAGLSAEDQAFVEAVIAKIGMTQLIPGVDSGTAGCVPAASPTEAQGSPTLMAQGSSAPMAQTLMAQGSQPAMAVGSPAGGYAPGGGSFLAAYGGGGGGCHMFPLEIQDGDQLAAALEKGTDAQVREGGAEERVLRDINSIVDVGENLPGVYGDLIDMVGVMFATLGLWFEMDAGVYPTSFTSLTAEGTITDFNEDFTQRGQVSEAIVVAASTGFNAAEAFAEVAAEVGDALAGAAVGSYAGPAGEEAEGRLALFLGGKLRKAILEGLIQRLGAQFLEYCPQSWSVDITHSDYIDVEAVIGRFTQDKPSINYWPDESLGADALGDDRIRVRAKSEFFHGVTAETHVAVRAIRLRVVGTPEEVMVDRPGDTVAITAEVRNADTPTLFWNTPHGTWDDGIGADTNDGRTRPLKTPTDPAAYPFVIEIRSTSETGLREGRTESDPRVDTVTVRLKELIVTPDPGSVRVGDSLDFLATDRDGTPQPVRWTATGGTIASQDSAGIVTGIGRYVAGDRPGIYTVTAISLRDARITTTVEVEVLEDCNPVGTWRLREQEFLDQVAAMGSGVIMTHLSGAYYVVFEGEPTGGTMIQDRDAFMFRMETAEGALVMLMSGTEVGTWSTSGAFMNVVTTGSDVQISAFIEFGGALHPLPGGGQDVDAGPSFSSAPFTCTNNVMTATVSDGSGSITMTMDKVGG